MPPLSASARARLPDSAFAYVDSGGRRLPIHDVRHVSQRARSAGHGGQILLSPAARDALARGRPVGVTFRTLGQYALAGLAEAEALFRVHGPELRARFPRLRT